METINEVLGVHAEKIQAYQMAIRLLIVFVLSMVYIRIAGIRTLGKTNAFDQLTLLIFGTIMGNAVFNNQPFWGFLLVGFILVLLHRFIAWITFRSHKIGLIIKGATLSLYEKGEKNVENIKREHISDQDLHEAIRVEIHTNEMDKVKEIYLERSGEISVIKKEE